MNSRWFRRVEEGAELFIRNWHEKERRKAAERRAKAAAAPSTVGISKWPGRGRRGEGGGRLAQETEVWVWPSSSRNCGPSNSRHKIAEDRPDFFAMLRYLPSAIVDALDTLYEPSVVLSQFLGSVSMTFFSLSFPCFLVLSCLFLLFLSFLFFRFLFVFFASLSFISFALSSFLFFVPFSD